MDNIFKILHSTYFLKNLLTIIISTCFFHIHPYSCPYSHIQTLSPSHRQQPGLSLVISLDLKNVCITWYPVITAFFFFKSNNKQLSEMDLADPLPSILSHRIPTGENTCPPLGPTSGSIITVMFS